MKTVLSIAAALCVTAAYGAEPPRVKGYASAAELEALKARVTELEKSLKARAAPCVCGDSCACAAGECPGKCPTARVAAPARAASGYKYPDHVMTWMGGRVVGSDDPGFVSVSTNEGSWTVNLGRDVIYLNGERYDPSGAYRFRDARSDELTMWYAWTGPCRLSVRNGEYHFESVTGEELEYGLRHGDEILKTMSPADRKFHERADLVYSWFRPRLKTVADCRRAWAEWDRTHPNGWDGRPPAQVITAAVGVTHPAPVQGDDIHVSPDGTVNRLCGDGVYRPVPGAAKRTPPAVTAPVQTCVGGSCAAPRYALPVSGVQSCPGGRCPLPR